MCCKWQRVSLQWLGVCYMLQVAACKTTVARRVLYDVSNSERLVTRSVLYAVSDSVRLQ